MKQKLIIYIILLVVLSTIFGWVHRIQSKKTTVPVENKVETVEVQKDSLDLWLDKLAFCESSNNPLAVNPKDKDGRPKYGLFQFDIETWKMYIKRYNLFNHQDWEDADYWNSIYSRDHQEIVIREMMKNGVNMSKEFGCVRKIGLFDKKIVME